jgi:hypothetical protein
MLFPLMDNNIESSYLGPLSDLLEHTRRQQRDASHCEGSYV